MNGTSLPVEYQVEEDSESEDEEEGKEETKSSNQKAFATETGIFKN